MSLDLQPVVFGSLLKLLVHYNYTSNQCELKLCNSIHLLSFLIVHYCWMNTRWVSALLSSSSLLSVSCFMLRVDHYVVQQMESFIMHAYDLLLNDLAKFVHAVQRVRSR